MTGSTNEGKLWGGRFAGGPVARARGAVAVDPLRLAARALRPRRLPRARQRAARGRAAHRRRPRARCSAGSTPSAAAYAAGVAAARTRPTRTCTAPRAAADRARSAPSVGGRLRAGRSRNDQVATLFKAYLRDQARGVAARAPRPRRRARRPGARPPRRGHARPHPPPARPAGPAVPPPARPRLAAAPRRRPAARLGRPRGRGLAVRLGCAGRLQPGPRPAGRRRRARLHRLERQLHRRHGGPRLRGRVRLRRRA